MIKAKKVNKDYSDRDGRYFWVTFDDKTVPIIFDIETKKVYDWLIVDMHNDRLYNDVYNNMLVDKYIDSSGVVIGVCNLNTCRDRNDFKKVIKETNILESIEKIVVDSLL